MHTALAGHSRRTTASSAAACADSMVTGWVAALMPQGLLAVMMAEST
jgi:hypothetical protein